MRGNTDLVATVINDQKFKLCEDLKLLLVFENIHSLF